MQVQQHDDVFQKLEQPCKHLVPRCYGKRMRLYQQA
jgi:hypothetical protein